MARKHPLCEKEHVQGNPGRRALGLSRGGWGDENETLAFPSEDAAPVQPSLSPPSAAGSWVASSAGQPGGLSGTALGDTASP